MIVGTLFPGKRLVVARLLTAVGASWYKFSYRRREIFKEIP
jgi:hypothetical protein